MSMMYALLSYFYTTIHLSHNVGFIFWGKCVFSVTDVDKIIH